MTQIAQVAARMKMESPIMAATTVEQRNEALARIKESLLAHADEVFAANALDLEAAERDGVAPAVVKRLRFDEHKLADVAAGIDGLIGLPDPVGRTLLRRELDEGLVLERVSVPIGVIGVIFEARPDALVQISTLCLKSGNCAILKGGKGGNGNMHYATSTMQAPKYAQPGQPSRTLELRLELKVIADVGLVGFPNVGKATLLSRASNAKPRIANYHFTTLTPILGVVDLQDARGFVMADIPGLIEGAAEGAGLGHEFLAHIERTKLLIHVVDAAGSEGRDPVEDIKAINKELASYEAEIGDKKQILAANKCDLLPEGSDALDRIREYCSELGVEVFPISAATGEGVRELLYHVSGILAQMPDETTVFEQEYDPEEMLQLDASEPFTVSYDEKAKEYVIEGPRVERMLGYTNLETEKGFIFFQKFLQENKIIDRLKELGCKEGDTVRLYGHRFDYYD